MNNDSKIQTAAMVIIFTAVAALLTTAGPDSRNPAPAGTKPCAQQQQDQKPKHAVCYSLPPAAQLK